MVTKEFKPQFTKTNGSRIIRLVYLPFMSMLCNSSLFNPFAQKTLAVKYLFLCYFMILNIFFVKGHVIDPLHDPRHGDIALPCNQESSAST
jgi:hypothetical protein